MKPKRLVLLAILATVVAVGLNEFWPQWYRYGTMLYTDHLGRARTSGGSSPGLREYREIPISIGDETSLLVEEDVSGDLAIQLEELSVAEAVIDACYFGECPEPISDTIENCLRLGVSGPCLDWSLFSQLERAEYAFNAPQEMPLAEPHTIALVIDTTGTTNFDDELRALPGAQARGETPISLIMEAEIVGPAFEITPSGRQRRELSELNPTRWDWEVEPARSGEHQLEVSLYVIASSDGESIREEKALAERRVITVTIPPLNQVTDLISKIDPILAFLVAIGGAIAAVLAWFGFKNWRELTGRGGGESKTQKIEVTIKNAADEES